MDDETDNLISHETGYCAYFIWITYNQLAVVFTIQYHPDGTVNRFKARLVARGFTQTYRVNYLKTSSVTE